MVAPDPAANRRMLPSARRPSASMANPAASTDRSVSRLGWQPPANHVHGRLDRILEPGPPRPSSIGRARARAASPSGRSTRRASASARGGSLTLQSTRPLTTVSKTASRNGSASAAARHEEHAAALAGARARARRAKDRLRSRGRRPVERQVATGPTAEIERQSARASDQPAPPAPEPAPLREPRRGRRRSTGSARRRGLREQPVQHPVDDHAGDRDVEGTPGAFAGPATRGGRSRRPAPGRAWLSTNGTMAAASTMCDRSSGM